VASHYSSASALGGSNDAALGQERPLSVLHLPHQSSLGCDDGRLSALFQWKLDNLVAGYIEQGLLQPERLERFLSQVRRIERAERRRSYIAHLRERQPRQMPNSKRFYDAISMAS
jgi:hypothetical protein